MPRKPVVDLPENVFRVVARGKPYYYHQPHRGTPKAGTRTPVPGTPHDTIFWSKIKELNGYVDSKSVAAMVGDFLASPEYGELSETTRRDYKRYLDIIVKSWGPLVAKDILPKHVAVLRSDYSGTPVAANHLVSVLSTVCKWGIVAGYTERNPCADINRLKVNTRGKNKWPEWAFRCVEKYGREDVRLGVFLGSITGQRPSDLIRMRPTDLEGNGIWVQQQKTGKRLWIAIDPEHIETLREIERSPFQPWVLSPKGEPYDMQRYQQVWQRFVNLNRATALLRKHRLSLHGLRATACMNLYLAGASVETIADTVGMSVGTVRSYLAELPQKERAEASVFRIGQNKNGTRTAKH